MQRMILIPSTFTADEKNLMLRTYKIGMVARAAATFGITDIGVYYDPDPKFDSHGLGRFIVKVLKYINTPPYLRKIAFEKDESLRYIGVVEPLKTPHHLDRKYAGRYRYMYVLRKEGKYIVVTDGVRRFRVRMNENYRKGERIIVIDLKTLRIVDKKDLPVYYGYDVFYFNRELKKLLEKLRKRKFCIIGTSRYGDTIDKMNISCSGNIVIVFGSPFRGLREIIGEQYRKHFDYFINIVPEQVVETIRTEEAIYYALAVMRLKHVI